MNCWQGRTIFLGRLIEVPFYMMPCALSLSARPRVAWRCCREACQMQKISLVVAGSCMVLVDTSIWIDLLRGVGPLGDMLSSKKVQTHPFVIGELACGSLPDRKATLQLLQELPAVQVAGLNEVIFFIERHQLMARGIGYVDMHLLAAAALNSCKLFTRDKRLHAVADELSLAYYHGH